ncbi:HAD family phosphatase [Streptomyces sp. MUM 203J]|uniref:HAD family hydrolase n=1 Tax=Streptomyces sp. MUM 203J TaxID=2791990 RepID=UPI001F042C3A|nr:HAD-IB family hydrolase [Streptomyces sp. MUM 203J]
MPADPRLLVFCDVDETLIHCKSVLDFLPYYWTGRHGPAGTRRAEAIVARLTAMLAGGAPREEANAAYHRSWRGEDLADVDLWARKWFDERSAAPDFWVPATARALRRHRAEGAAVVLVSGSLPSLLRPVAEAVGAYQALGACPEHENGVLTGATRGLPAVGEGKRALVREVLARHPRIPPEDCWAYGDHPSDLPMLACVGHPRLLTPSGTLITPPCAVRA